LRTTKSEPLPDQNSSPNDPDVVELKPHRGIVIRMFPNGGGAQRRLSLLNKETPMNWDQIETDWMQFKGKLRHNWVKLTDEDITRINGRREELVARLQERYGFAKAEAEREIGAWMKAQRRAA
jgi:uncharacterized protein YjbJ (UPF0337 family)